MHFLFAGHMLVSSSSIHNRLYQILICWSVIFYPISPKVVLPGCALNWESKTDNCSELNWLVTTVEKRVQIDVRRKEAVPTKQAWQRTTYTTVSFLLAEIESRFMSSKILLMNAVSRGNGLFSCFLLRGKLSVVGSLYLFPTAPTPPTSALEAAQSL